VIDHRPTDIPDIEQAPSPADIAAADERVGRVDFTRRLGNRRARDLVDVSAHQDERDDPHLVVLPPAKVEAILAAENAKLAAEAAANEDDPLPGPGPTPGSTSDPDPPSLRPDREPDLDVGQSVEEIAASIIASMRTIEETHHRHLEALEAEATRRYELLLAQAELDAELIRLNGRREAHRIIASARARTGAEQGGSAGESSRLQEIGETFTRFAQTIESAAAAPPPSDPDLDHGTT
jgi:hypothetical protein